ncbi:50S ribosomal protein L22 [Candidatus Riesia sp. GBBU]|nr:50S ribosomal protein L22 [Candidatus Riesia sp. GBBU]
MKAIAKYKYAKSSAQKIRLVANLIRNKSVYEANNILENSNKKSARLIKKLLNSAVANAKHNNKMKSEKLKVYSIFVDEGSRFKRIIPRAKGHADNILKRTSHITLVISD